MADWYTDTQRNRPIIWPHLHMHAPGRRDIQASHTAWFTPTFTTFFVKGTESCQEYPATSYNVTLNTLGRAPLLLGPFPLSGGVERTTITAADGLSEDSVYSATVVAWNEFGSTSSEETIFCKWWSHWIISTNSSIFDTQMWRGWYVWSGQWDNFVVDCVIVCILTTARNCCHKSCLSWPDLQINWSCVKSHASKYVHWAVNHKPFFLQCRFNATNNGRALL